MRNIFYTSTIILFSIYIVKGISMQEMYNNALPTEKYNKLIILENNVLYTGGFTQHVEKVCIEGNGAIIDLQGENILLDGENKEILIHHCILLSTKPYGNYVLLKNNATGLFFNNTFYSIKDSVASATCLRFEECTYGTNSIFNNIFVNFSEAVFFYTMDYEAGINLEISYNDIWNCPKGSPSYNPVSAE